jgi:hypothetical protein
VLEELNSLITSLGSLLIAATILTSLNQNLRSIIKASSFLKLRAIQHSSEEYLASKAPNCGQGEENGILWTCKELKNKKFIFLNEN